MKIILDAPAKLNLSLKVCGKRPDGFHELVTLMQPIDLCDRLHLDLDAPELVFSCNQPELAGEHNLVVRAARAWFAAARIEPRAVIHLEKLVPVAAGIGGGSSDAATTLTGLNALHGGRLSPRRMHELAAALGSDVPFFLGGVTAWCTGRGEKVTPWPDFPLLHYVAVNSGLEVSTAWAYRTYDLHWTNLLSNHTIGFPRKVGRFWENSLLNDLETVTITEYPEIAEIKKGLMAAGAEGALMSGSGPTVFGIFPDSRTARNAALRLEEDTGYWVRACRGTAV